MSDKNCNCFSNGDIKKLKTAAKLAKTDWRDLLVNAGFAEDVNAHNIWADTILQGQ